MIHINLLGNKSHFDKFCDAMNRCVSCREKHCEKTCWAMALKNVQEWCSQGMELNKAVRKWWETGLSHKEGAEILCNIMKVEDLNKLRELIKKDKP